MSNDSKCQKVLYEHYYGFALKAAFRYIYRYDRAVDIVNDGFVKIFRSIEKFDGADTDHLEPLLMAWIRRIVVNTAIDELRRNQLLPEIGELSDDYWELSDKSAGADGPLLYKELIVEVKKLPPSYRAVFNMFVIDGYSHQEIADRLGISAGTSKSNLSKAKEYLKKTIYKDVARSI